MIIFLDIEWIFIRKKYGMVVHVLFVQYLHNLCSVLQTGIFLEPRFKMFTIPSHFLFRKLKRIFNNIFGTGVFYLLRKQVKE